MPQVLTAAQIAEFEEQGFLRVDRLLSEEQVGRYLQLYDQFLAGHIATGHLRSDLGSHVNAEGDDAPSERITQIMWPSALVPVLHDALLHQRSLAMARQYFGDDMNFDFDMLIDKPPGSNTPTPWHQDMAYWIKLPDTRSVSVWVALDESTVDNGCMWYVPGSHKEPLRSHREAGKGGGALQCDASEAEGIPVPIPAGSAVLHQGGSLHYSRGNRTDGHRRAFIVNCRPRAMIELERDQGMDHGLTDNTRRVRNKRPPQ